MRKSLRVRPGYTPLEEQTKYKSKGTLIKEQRGPNSLPVGMEMLTRPASVLPVGLSGGAADSQSPNPKKKAKRSKKLKTTKPEFEIEEPDF